MLVILIKFPMASAFACTSAPVLRFFCHAGGLSHRQNLCTSRPRLSTVYLNLAALHSVLVLCSHATSYGIEAHKPKICNNYL